MEPEDHCSCLMLTVVMTVLCLLIVVVAGGNYGYCCVTAPTITGLSPPQGLQRRQVGFNSASGGGLHKP